MEDEINLRDLVETLLRARWLIAAVTAVAVLVSGVLSFFVLSPEYKATATLLVNQPPQLDRSPKEPGLELLLSRLSTYPPMTIETFRRQVTNESILAKVIGDLKLDMTPEALAARLDVKSPKDTNLIEITATDENPARAAQIANSLAAAHSDFVGRRNQDLMQKTGEFLRQQIQVEEKNLAAALNALKKFLEQPRGVEELTKEMEEKVKLLASYKARQVEVAVKLHSELAAVERGTADLATTPETLTTKRSIADDPYLHQLAATLGNTSLVNLSGLSMQSQEVNKAHTELVGEINKRKMTAAALQGEQANLAGAIAQVERDLERLRSELAEKQITHDQLQQKVKLLKDTIAAFSKRYEETRISQGAKIAESSLTLAAPATAPVRPVGPRKAFNLAVAGVLGLMVGVFLAYFLEFWNKTDPATMADRAASAKF